MPASPLSRWMIGLGLVSMVTMGGGVVYFSHQARSTPIASPATTQSTVNALGRLQPQGEIIHVAAPASVGSLNRVEQLLVNEGDRVRFGQVIAILDSRDRLQSALKEAQEQVKVAQAKLRQVQAGTKPRAVAQQAVIAQLNATLQHAQVEFQRYQSLFRQGVISASTLDSKSLAVKTAQAQLNEAEANLNRMADIHPADTVVAQAEVDRARAAVTKAQAELNSASVRAPKAGEILKVQTRAGETISDQGIVELGQTDQMYVIAEIYESDIAKIRVGQSAKIEASAIAGELHGTVDQIGRKIAKQDVLNTDPTAATDARVVEVKIRLDQADSQRVANLTNLQVNVEVTQ